MAILYGTRPSFYTRKAWAAMRLLGLEVDDRLKTLAVGKEVEAAVGGYHRFPVVQTDQGDWLVDSTTIGLALSARHPAQALLPGDEALAALLLLAEEWLDEWFLRGTLAWRPVDADTRAWVAARAAANMFGFAEPEEAPAELAPKLAKAAANVEGFFQSAGAVNGVTAETVAAVRAQLDLSLEALETALADSPYLGGTRPSLADAALWGFLEAGLLWEPAPCAHVSARCPGLLAFHARLGGLAEAGGRPLGEWDALETVAARLAPLLGGEALGFVPFLAANRRALADGTKRLRLDGVEVPARGYTEKGRQALARRIAALSPEDRRRLDMVAGDWPLTRLITEEDGA